MHAMQTLNRCFSERIKRERNTTTNSVDFPTWFSFGCYSGLACCMFAIAINALYTSLRRRGTTRQLAGAIVTCVISALLLLPAIIWYNMRFAVEQAAISVAEVEVALVYVALFGWFLPLSVTVTYCLFSLPRVSTTSIQVQVPHQRRTSTGTLSGGLADQPGGLVMIHHAPTRQPGEDAPY